MTGGVAQTMRRAGYAAAAGVGRIAPANVSRSARVSAASAGRFAVSTPPNGGGSSREFRTLEAFLRSAATPFHRDEESSQIELWDVLQETPENPVSRERPYLTDRGSFHPRPVPGINELSDSTARIWETSSITAHYGLSPFVESFLELARPHYRPDLVVWDGGCGILDLSLAVYFDMLKKTQSSPRAIVGIDVNESHLMTALATADRLGIARKVRCSLASVDELSSMHRAANHKGNMLLFKDVTAVLSKEVFESWFASLECLEPEEVAVFNFPIHAGEFVQRHELIANFVENTKAEPIECGGQPIGLHFPHKALPPRSFFWDIFDPTRLKTDDERLCPKGGPAPNSPLALALNSMGLRIVEHRNVIQLPKIPKVVVDKGGEPVRLDDGSISFTPPTPTRELHRLVAVQRR